MLDIKIYEEEKEHDESEKRCWVAINNIPDENSFIGTVYIGNHNKKYNDLNLFSWEAFKELSKYSIADLEPFGFAKIHYDGIIDEYNVMTEHDSGSIDIIIFSDSEQQLAHSVKWIIHMDSERWSKPWSIKEFTKELETQIELQGDNFAYWQCDSDYATSGFGISYLIDKEKLLQNAIDELEVHLKNLFEKTNRALLRKIDEDSLITFFQFKDSASIASKQYLIYFAQFLADLGIDADTELTQQAHNTLFKVIPKDKNQSLQQIKEALDVYLAASGMEVSKLNSLATESNDIAIHQWLSTISHLQSQLHLANAIISAKDAESQYLRETNLHYKKQLLLSVPTPENAAPEKFEVIPGIVSVGQYDGNGVTINIARLVKMLRRKLGFGK
jgi:hypothetical protein